MTTKKSGTRERELRVQVESAYPGLVGGGVMCISNRTLVPLSCVFLDWGDLNWAPPFLLSSSLFSNLNHRHHLWFWAFSEELIFVVRGIRWPRGVVFYHPLLHWGDEG